MYLLKVSRFYPKNLQISGMAFLEITVMAGTVEDSDFLISAVSSLHSMQLSYGNT